METTCQGLQCVLFKGRAVEVVLKFSKERASPGAQKYYSSEYGLNLRQFFYLIFVPKDSSTLMTLKTGRNKFNKLKKSPPKCALCL